MGSKRTSLEQWQAMWKSGFESVAVDIVGFCNAKCKYCPSGNDLSHAGEYMSPDFFQKIVNKLLDYSFVTKETSFHIYGLGEPMLHPQINEILHIIEKCGLTTNISTNASKVPTVDQAAVKAVNRILISMPGFSQKSYDKIHGFNFEQIKRNILKLKEEFVGVPFDMTYHIYQFNMNEMEDARKFCEENNIRFAPNYAVIFEKSKCMELVDGTMAYDELLEASTDLFLNVLRQQIDDSPRNYCDYKERYLSINCRGDVRTCSAHSSKIEDNMLCGNLLRDDVNDILYRKNTHPWCNLCISKGLTCGKGYDCKVFPDFYFSLLREKEFYQDLCPAEKNGDAIKEIEVMHQIRKWEEMHYDDKEYETTQKMIQKSEMDEESVKSIIMKYSRFKDKTYDKLYGRVKA